MIWDTYSAQDGGFQEGDFAGDGIVGPEDTALWYQIYSAGFNLQNPFLAADVDEDGDVDDDDLQILSDNYGMTGATRADGDANGNGTIDDAVV